MRILVIPSNNYFHIAKLVESAIVDFCPQPEELEAQICSGRKILDISQMLSTYNCWLEKKSLVKFLRILA